MRALRMLLGLVALACLVPPLSLLLASLLARWAGCDIDPDAPVTCHILGGDYGDILYGLTHFGWYAIFTLPILAAVLVAWILIEIVRSIGKPRSAAPHRHTSASSRKRERGS
jgi:uncharacterized membrane protein